MSEAERSRATQIWKDNAPKSKMAEVEERERRADIKGEDHVRFLGEKLRKMKESWAKHDVEVRDMETKKNRALEELRVDLVWLLPEESLDVRV